MTYEFHEAASAEFEEAIRYYESRRAGLGGRFAEVVLDGARQLTTHPYSGAGWPEVRPDLQARRLVLRRFPFVLAYVVADQTVLILAVAHTKRMPFYWVNRARSH